MVKRVHGDRIVRVAFFQHPRSADGMHSASKLRKRFATTPTIADTSE